MQDDLFVDAASGITVGKDLISIARRFFLPQYDEIDAHDFQCGRCIRTVVNRLGIRAAKPLCKHLGLFGSGSDETVCLAAMLHAFADGEYRSVVYTRQVITDNNSALNGELGLLR